MAAFLAAEAPRGLAVATVRRDLPTIHRVHDNIGQPSPTASTLLRATMAGIVRVHTAPSKQIVPGQPGSFVSTVSAMIHKVTDTLADISGLDSDRLRGNHTN